MDNKTKIIIGLGLIILILLGFLFIPKITNSFKDRYRNEGIIACVGTIINTINQQGFIDLIFGEQTMRIGGELNG